jgi:hypothetical protein
MEDVRPLVESGGYGAEALKRVDRSLDFVAALVDRLVEAGRSAARAAAALAVGPLVLALGDVCLICRRRRYRRFRRDEYALSPPR